jgi:hypothetical protein
MRMLKVALALLVLASFVVAATAVSMAAAATPTIKPMATKIAVPTMKAAMPNTMKMPTMGNTTVKTPAVGNPTIMPTQKPGMLIGLSEMQSNIGNVYKSLKNTTKMPKSMSGTGAGLAGMASKMMGGYMGKTSSGQGQTLLPDVPAPQAISQLGGMPQLGKMVKIA